MAEDAERAIEALGKKLRQFVENLCRDGQISESLMIELLEQLVRVDVGDHSAVIEKCLSVCHAHQGMGETLPDAQERPLGHVTTRRKLERVFESPASFRTPLTRAHPASRRLDEVLARDGRAQRNDLAGVKLSRHQMWGFYLEEFEGDPFEIVGTTDLELRDCLGLGHLVDSDVLLYFAYELAEGQRASVPTAFDGAENEGFRPGGAPHSEHGPTGVVEVVHSPIDGTQLFSPIRQVRT